VATITRLAVLDHGEAAVRVLTAVHGLDADDPRSVATVLVHPGVDRHPWYGREADESIVVPAGAPVEQLVGALRQASVDAVWVGRIADRAGVVEACERAGIVPVGPAAHVLRRSLGLTLPTSEPSPSGRRRRVELDVVADDHGTVWCIGGRDVSIRRAGRTLLAEAPFHAASDDLVARMRAMAIDVAARVDLRGAGTVVLTHDGDSCRVEALDLVASPAHATTEERTGVSIIGQRVRIARGEPLPAVEPTGEGVAVEAHLLAEDPLADFAVEPAEVSLLAFPAGTGVRTDANRRPGDPIDGADPVLAVMTAWGPDRPTAIGRLRRALERTSVVLTAGGTNRSLLLSILRHPDVVAGDLDEDWLDRHLPELLSSPADAAALLAAAVEAYEADRALAQAAFLSAAAHGRPESPRPVGGRILLTYRGVSYALAVGRTGPDRYAVRHGDAIADVTVERLDPFEGRLTCGGRGHRVVVSPTATGVRVDVDGTTHLVDRDDGTVVAAGWPALVVAVTVEPGQRVAAGEPIAVLESMKMETTVTAPFEGLVVAVEAAANSRIERGAPLLRLRPSGRRDAVEQEPPVELRGFGRRIDPTRKVCERVYEPLGEYVLGYDLAPDDLARLLVQQRRLAEIADPADVDLMACEDSLLDIYADLGALSRPRTELEPTDGDPPDDPTPGSDDWSASSQEYLASFAQWLDADRAGLPARYRERLLGALARYDVRSLDRSPELEAALTWLFRSLARLTELSGVVQAILQRRLDHRRRLAAVIGPEDGARLDRLAAATQGRQQAIADLARDVRFHFFDEPLLEEASAAMLAEMAARFDALVAAPDGPDAAQHLARLVTCPCPLRALLVGQWRRGDADATAGADATSAGARRIAAAEVYVQRFYRIRDIAPVRHHRIDGLGFATTEYSHEGRDVHLVVSFLPLAELPAMARAIARHVGEVTSGRLLVVDLVTWRQGLLPDIAEAASAVTQLAAQEDFGRQVHRLDVTITSSEGPEEEHLRTQIVTLRQAADGSWCEEELFRNLHPMLAKRLELWRLANFHLERRPSPEDVYLFFGVAHENPDDRRLFALAEIRELTSVTDPVTGEVHVPRLERTGLLALAAMRAELARHPVRERPVANRLVLDVTAPWTMSAADLGRLSDRFAGLAARAGLEKVVVKVRIPDDAAPDGLRAAVLHLEQVDHTVLVREDVAGTEPVRPLGAYRQKVLTAARFGAPYPYEIARLLTRHGRSTDAFVELDLAPPGDGDGEGADDQLVPVDRPPGGNTAHVVVGLVTQHSEVVPEGIRRVALLSDPTQGLGNLAEPECRRINAALAYALERRIPVEWFAVSSGALISMDSGTENMDWIALTLRRLIEFTQAGGEINVVVTGINVGGQPYWNAEATMLMHTKGILIMTAASTMVLTGKQALEFSGAVSAEDNLGIGGYERVMGPNGQAHYFASSFSEACEILRRHYELTYVVPGERFPRRRPTTDPHDRDVRDSVHVELAGSPFRTVGDIFSSDLNPERKQPFDMRSVMRAVADADTEPLERWRDLRDGDTSIVWDTTVGGFPVLLLGIESHNVPRRGFVPADGPQSWTSGTLFPHSSRKTARAINAASGNRPLVVLANLSGFDGSPESMRRRQLEFGAEIGRAVTNFDGPIVFVVVSRYHGGAFVVFSKTLNESMEIAAVEGSFASVIGGAPAAATVFAREVQHRTQADERVRAATEAAAVASGTDAGAALRASLADVTAQVRSDKLAEVAREFDAVHTIERARQVGSVDRIIPAAGLRPYVIDALERGIARS
jgi:acetyl/propionyl-CoA carboxylase alpha subunit/acetyl-CoA carboxylase carboxyltransferase component